MTIVICFLYHKVRHSIVASIGLALGYIGFEVSASLSPSPSLPLPPPPWWAGPSISLSHLILSSPKQLEFVLLYLLITDPFFIIIIIIMTGLLVVQAAISRERERKKKEQLLVGLINPPIELKKVEL